jgi:hypothetical protein
VVRVVQSFVFYVVFVDHCLSFCPFNFALLYLSFLPLFTHFISSNFLSVIRMLYNLMVQWSKDLVIQKFSSPIVHFSDGLLVRKLHDLKIVQIFLLFVKV